MYHKIKIAIYKIRLSRAFKGQFHFSNSKLYSSIYIYIIDWISHYHITYKKQIKLNC